MSTIAAGITSGTALVSTGDTAGTLVFQTNGTTTAVTIGTNQVVTLAQPLPIASGGTGGSATPTAGGIVYGTGTAQAVTAAGTAGQYLQSNAGSAPTWVTASSGALILLSTVTASASATVDVESTFSSTYDAYVLVASKVTCSDNGSDISARFKIGGVYVSGGSDYQHNVITSASDSTAYRSRASDTQTAITILGSASNAASAQSNFTMHLHNPTSTTKQHTLYSTGVVIDNTDVSVSQAISVGKCTTLGALTGVRIRPGTGTISGTFSLYGLAK